MAKHHLRSQRLKCLLIDRIQELYQTQLEHQLSTISCQVFDNVLVIIMEGSLTKPEQLLKQCDRQELVAQIRTILNRLIQPQIRAAIEDITQSTIIDFFYDTTIDTERTGAIAIFELAPKHPVYKNSSASRDVF